MRVISDRISLEFGRVQRLRIVIYYDFGLVAPRLEVSFVLAVLTYELETVVRLAHPKLF